MNLLSVTVALALLSLVACSQARMPVAPNISTSAGDAVTNFSVSILPITVPQNDRQETITGIVMQINPGFGLPESFALSDGRKSYRVIMNNTGGTQVINLRGRQVPWQYIQVGNNVTVTGTASDSTIYAQIVKIPTIKDDT